MRNELYDYQSFLQAAATFPKFCNEGDADLCKRELSFFFGHTTHEVGYETEGYIYPTWQQGFYYITELMCTPEDLSNTDCDYKSGADEWSSSVWPSSDGVQYYGRGPFQISWNYNYGQLSTAIYDDATLLLEDPDLMATDGYSAFVSALWFYMTPQAPKPSIHELATKLYVPSASDVTKGLGPSFGASTMVINGGLECTTDDGTENANSLMRMEYH